VTASTYHASVITFLMIVSRYIIKLQSPLIHILYIIDDMPKHSLKQWRSSEATSVEPASPHINPR
jgi:hypothetical protein